MIPNIFAKRGIVNVKKKTFPIHIISCYRHPFNHRLYFAQKEKRAFHSNTGKTDRFVF